MKEQFFGKTFWWTLAGIATAHVVGWFALNQTTPSLILLGAAAVTIFIVAWRSLPAALFVAFAELFVDSHGHLISAWPEVPVGIRIALFVGIMAAWGLRWISGRSEIDWRDTRLLPLYVLSVAIAWGMGLGFLRNGGGDAFSDGNGYLYVAYALPVLSVRWDAALRRQFLQVFAASAVWLVLESLGLLYVFSHLPEPVMRATYTFIRDSRLGELTRMEEGIFRIFIQSQFTVVAMFFVALGALFWLWEERHERPWIFAMLSASLSVVLISLSRSFWFGMAAGLAALLDGLIVQRRLAVRRFFSRSAIAIGSLAAAVGMLFAVLLVPLPPGTGQTGLGNLLSERVADPSDAAISSRWNLLPVMTDAVREQPILGHGFGKVLAFKSEDPRVLALYDDGMWRTYRFEWGYLDIWVKMGLLGVIAFAWIFVAYGRALVQSLPDEPRWLRLGLLATFATLFAAHMFSPYLNHPIGLGFIVFLLVFLEPRPAEAVAEKAAAPRLRPAMAAPAPLAPLTRETE